MWPRQSPVETYTELFTASRVIIFHDRNLCCLHPLPQILISHLVLRLTCGKRAFFVWCCSFDSEWLWIFKPQILHQLMNRSWASEVRVACSLSLVRKGALCWFWCCTGLSLWLLRLWDTCRSMTHSLTWSLCLAVGSLSAISVIGPCLEFFIIFRSGLTFGFQI